MRYEPSRFYFLFFGIITLSFLSPTILFSQVQNKYDSTYIASINDTVQRYIRNHPWKFKPESNRLKVIPYFGVSYNEETNFGAVVGTIGYYRNGNDTLLPVSIASIMAGASINKSFYGGIRGLNYSRKGTFLLDYKFKYFYNSRYFWGFGFENGDNNSNKSSMIESGMEVRADFLYKPVKEILIGPFIGFEYYSSSDFSSPELIEGSPLYSRSFKAGIRFDYDSRDNVSSPGKGLYIAVRQVFYPGIVFGFAPYYKTSITTDFYFKAWEGSVFAFDVFGDFNYGDSPWFVWPQFGGDTRMRGYYEGRYRDRNMLSAQMEIRQRVYKSHSVAIFGGAGNIFHSFSSFNIKQTLPTYGAGYRFEFFGILLRVDVGFGTHGQYAILAGVNQAF